MTPENARALMHNWVQSQALRIHMETVGLCCRAYAQKLDPANADRWQSAGILHDFDYEKHPTAEEHPKVGVAHLRSLHVDDEILNAILGHAAERTGVVRETPMAKALFACDELAGFIVACAKVRPNGISDLEPKSVKKKLKDKAFAANVSREDIAQGIAELASLLSADPAIFETQHLQTCIDAIRAESKRLGI
jgi:putative nucleotidyltransferase with HDIG domain